MKLAQKEMRSLWNSVQKLSPKFQRDLLLDTIPALVRKYGNVAATAAADWYEQIRAKNIKGSYQATVADTFPDQGIMDTLRWKAGTLWDNPDVFNNFIQGSLSRWVQYAGRETIARNIRKDPAKPRWARVPNGKTCAFCEMLSSRGWVYTSPEKAGAGGNRFHPGDDCQIVPEWDRKNTHLKGYDPDAMYKRYQEAREIIKSGRVPKNLQAWFEDSGLTLDDPNDETTLTLLMRHLHPGQYTNGIRTLSQKWPDDIIRPSGSVWNHILTNHAPGSSVENKTRFPDTWDEEYIKWAVKETVVNPDLPPKMSGDSARQKRVKIIEDQIIRVWLQKHRSSDKRYKVWTAYPLTEQERSKLWPIIQESKQQPKD